MKIARANSFTPKKRRAFLLALEEFPNVTRAAKQVGVSPRLIYQWRDQNETFEKEFNEARRIGIDVLEGEAMRRGFEGNQRLKYGSEGREHVEIEFSDTMAIFLLKALRPEVYRERFDIRSRNDNRTVSQFTDDELEDVIRSKQD